MQTIPYTSSQLRRKVSWDCCGISDRMTRREALFNVVLSLSSPIPVIVVCVVLQTSYHKSMSCSSCDGNAACVTFNGAVIVSIPLAFQVECVWHRCPHQHHFAFQLLHWITEINIYLMCTHWNCRCFSVSFPVVWQALSLCNCLYIPFCCMVIWISFQVIGILALDFHNSNNAIAQTHHAYIDPVVWMLFPWPLSSLIIQRGEKA